MAKKMGRRKFLIAIAKFSLICAAILGVAPLLWGAVFNVTNVTQFQIALDTAEINSQSDIIYVAATTYSIITTLTYDPSGAENYPLTIIGQGGDIAILEGGDTTQIMSINTRDLSNDSNATITIENLAFRNGKMIDDSGGGLEVSTDSAGITIQNSEFSSNSSKYSGGGANISTDNGTITLTNNTFKDNVVTGGGPSYVVYSGGGLVAVSFYGAVNITSNLFRNNSVDVPAGSALGGGSRAYTSTGSVTYTNNIFRGNHTNSWGGGSYADTASGTITFTNNTFSNNSCSSGGGIYLTLDENGAIANIYNNIFWGNVGNNGGDMYVMDDREWDYTGSVINLYNNIYNDFYIVDGDNLSQGNNKSTNPLLTSDFHLRAGSQAIDSGICGMWTSFPRPFPLPPLFIYARIAPYEDFEGDLRPIFGSTTGCDIGADEFTGAPADPTVLCPIKSKNGKTHFLIF